MLNIALYAMLAAAGAMAAPSSMDIEARDIAVEDNTLGSNFTSAFVVDLEPSDSHDGDDFTSRNWSGFYQTPPKGSKFSSIKGTIKMPKPVNPKGTKGSHTVAAWVGIDGISPSKDLVQAGCLGDTENPMYCWYEWLPNPITPINDFNVNYDDTIEVTVTGLSKTKAKVVMHNVNSGDHVTKTFSAPTPTATLEGRTAEWIVEDISVGSGFSPFADFKTIDFKDCDAKAGKHSVDLQGAQTIELEIGGHIHTNVNRQSAHSFDVKYKS